MAEPSLIEVIAAKERELRARLLAARAEAEAIVADADRRAAALRRSEETAATAEIQAWLASELDRARRDVAAMSEAALAELRRRRAESVRRAAAVRRVLDAVLLRSPDGRE
jgi:hypothetical protein